MTLVERIRKDWIEARKARQEIPANLLGVLIGTIQTKGKNFSPERELTEAEVLKEIQSLLNGVVESKKLLGDANPNFAKLNEEETILSAYMPTQLNSDELNAIIKAKTDAGKDLKTIMTELRAEHAGRYDGKVAAELIKSAVSK
jgi:uncharacterized protein YqeY